MKELGATEADVVASVKDSKIVEINADKTMIRRIAPIPEVDTSTERSIYSVSKNFFLHF